MHNHGGANGEQRREQSWLFANPSSISEQRNSTTRNQRRARARNDAEGDANYKEDSRPSFGLGTGAVVNLTFDEEQDHIVEIEKQLSKKEVIIGKVFTLR